MLASYHSVLGVDPGIKHTGFAFVSGNHKVIKSGVIITPSALTFQIRLGTIIGWLKTHMGSHSYTGYTMLAVCVENQTLFARKKHFRTAIDSTIKVQGAVMGWAMGRGLKVMCPTAQQWQSTLVRKKRGKKKLIQKKVSQSLGREVGTHEADAIGLALFGLREVERWRA